jgi:DoxX-like family
MTTIAEPNPFAGASRTETDSSDRALWAGRILSGVGVLFLTFDAVAKLLRLQPVIEATAQLGYRPGVIVPLGAVLLSCVLVYVVPRTSLLGALLLTGYLGGAVATHVRVGSPLFTHVLFPTYVAALVWGGLLLRDRRLQAFLPWRDRSDS